MPPAAGIRIQLLGPIAAERDGNTVKLGGPKQRAALALLASRPGVVFAADGLIHALWGDEPPSTAATALQGHISQLRRLLGADVIVTRDPGYLLALAPEEIDAGRFERLLDEARALPITERIDPLRSALGLWCGPALADVAARATGLDELAARLDDRRLEAKEELFDAELALGRHFELVAELEAFVRTEPERERAVGQLMLALYRGGRQSDALAAYRRFRSELNASLALEPTQALRELERRILIQDPTLAPLAAARPEQQRRLPITVAAVGFVPADDADPEVYAQEASHARETLRLIFERHGAVVERAGNAVLGLFGTPAPSDDDAARALAAARAALETVDASRAGVASGDAYGTESPAVEQALRLQANAAAGGLEVDALTVSRARPRDFQLDRALAGRADELRRLLALYDSHRRGLTVLVGPPGIGKSRLAEELTGLLPEPTRVLRTRCLSYGDGVGLLPAAELVRAASGLPLNATAEAARTRLDTLLANSEHAPAAVEQLLDVLGLAGDPNDAAPGWAVRRLLEAPGTQTLVLLDDLQWAAPAFLEVVERLAESALFVVATSREELPLAGTTIHLAPLESDACATLVRDLLGGEVEPVSLERLTEHSGGNPLFLEELVRDARASGRLRRDGAWVLDDFGETLPQSLRSLLAMRIERLPEPERDLLARCSVLGTTFTLAWLNELADGEVEEPLSALIASHLLQPASAADDLEFRHGLIRDAAYASLPLALKADLHARVAVGLDLQPTGLREREALSVHHLDQAYRARATLAPGDPQVAARAELATRASALAHSLLAEGDAAAASSLLERVLELEPDRALARIELGRARYDAGELAAADEAWSLVAGARARVGRVEVRLHTEPECDLESAAAELDGLLATVRADHDGDGVVEALLARAYVSSACGRIAELEGILDDALAAAQSAGRSRAEAEMLFLACGASWYGPRPVADGIRRCEDVLGHARERPIVEAAALQALGVLRAMCGETELARDTVAASRQIRRDIGQELGAAASAIDAGLVELLAGDYAAAEAVLRDGYAQLEALGETGYFSTLAGLLAEAVEAQGRPEEARELAHASAGAAAPGDVASQVSWRVAESRALVRLGEAHDAETLARQAVVIAEPTDFSLARADAWAALGNVELAMKILADKGLDERAVRAWTRSPELAPPSGASRPNGTAGLPR